MITACDKLKKFVKEISKLNKKDQQRFISDCENIKIINFFNTIKNILKEEFKFNRAVDKMQRIYMGPTKDTFIKTISIKISSKSYNVCTSIGKNRIIKSTLTVK